jgi:hypothetical protein
MSETVGIFGYGSLVNRSARRHQIDARELDLRGWRRSWTHCVETERGGVCALTIVPSANEGVRGVLLDFPRAELPALDARELGYRRIAISRDATGACGDKSSDQDMFTYVSTEAASRPGSREFPIWRSYLECVLAGYYDLGGVAAVREFLATTRGWGVPILDDRNAPKYMRAVMLSDETRRRLDELIHERELDALQFSEPLVKAPTADPLAGPDEFG